ncbi:hypothetical protein [Fictibacillus sp. NRS-1165]|uniref:hypothetical protein n=1 Tax=Fictibacillus sp. NRS-1165 TaxID=3144463 RepID=UPI003D1F5A4C
MAPHPYRTVLLFVIILFLSIVLMIPIAFFPMEITEKYTLGTSFLGSVLGGIIGGIFTVVGIKWTIDHEKREKYIDRIPARIVDIELLERDILDFIFNQYRPALIRIFNTIETQDTTKAFAELEKLRNHLVTVRYDWKKRAVSLHNQLYKTVSDANEYMLQTHDAIKKRIKTDENQDLLHQKFVLIGSSADTKLSQEINDIRTVFKQQLEQLKRDYDSYL